MFKWLLLIPLALSPAIAAAASISTYPEQVIQGEPLLVTLLGVTSTTSVQKISFGGSALKFFSYQNSVSAFVGIDLYKKLGTYPLVAKLTDGTTLQKDIVVAARPKVELPFTIPQKLGGNTAQSQQTLVSTLAAENASLANLFTGTKSFWRDPFVWPLANITVTDPYGYSRATGAVSVAHKGTDFRAAEGTKVMAINRGVVRLTKTYRDYGKTVVVDHGLGLMSFYMHLSKINVAQGQLVLPGQVVGLSGHTGYAEQPHLHLTIRIDGTSIDPIKFFALFKPN